MVSFANMFLARLSRLEDLRIGVRLRLVFACVLLFMLAGSTVSLWYFQNLRDRTRRVSEAEQRVTAVVRVNNSLLTLMSRLHRAADNHDAKYFEAEAGQLLSAFRRDTESAAGTFREIAPVTGREAMVVDSFNQMRAELPRRIFALIQLANIGDWLALHARLSDQVDHTDDVAEALMREADADLSQAQQRLSEDIDEAERRAMESLAGGSILALIAAALLGMAVTRSITGPLTRLDTGARALARGDFGHRVNVKGSNELANLGKAFDQTAQELARLYEQVRHSEARFRSLIEKGSDLILIVSGTGTLLYSSPSSGRVLGYSPEALVGRTIWEMVSPTDAQLAHGIFVGDKSAAGSMQPFELHFQRKDGSPLLLEGIVTNLLGDAAVGGILVNARDISERRQAEEALRRSEEQLRLITDSLPVLISYVDREHRYVFSNQQHERWFNQSRQQLTGARVEEVMGNEAYRAFNEYLEMALRGDSVTYETTVSREEEGERHVRTIMIPDFDEHRQVRGFVSLAEDITADKRAEAALRASEERLQELLARENEARKTAELLNQIGRILSAELDEKRLTQSLTDIATQLIGAEFGGLFSNTGAEQFLISHSGAQREAVERLALLRPTLLWPAFGDHAAIRLADLRNDPDYVDRISPSDRQNGYQAVASYLAVPVISRSRDVLGTLLFGHSEANKFSQHREDLIRGICAQAAIALDNAYLFKRLNIANRALQESNQALQRANEDLNVFAFSASHDLQEPLRNISLYSQLLQRRYHGKLDSQSDEFIKYLVEGAGRMSELINDLLAYIQVSNIHTENLTAIPAESAVERALLGLRAAVLANKATVVSGNLPAVTIEVVHLQQLFQNLIGNAIKYRSEEPPEIRISARETGGYWEFSVKDNGIGIDPRYSMEVFKPFKRLHGRASHPGTGIGLAICQKIVDRYGGRIWIEAHPGKGSDFRFILPQYDRPLEEPATI